jgi:hypothetical protein
VRTGGLPPIAQFVQRQFRPLPDQRRQLVASVQLASSPLPLQLLDCFSKVSCLLPGDITRIGTLFQMAENFRETVYPCPAAIGDLRPSLPPFCHTPPGFGCAAATQQTKGKTQAQPLTDGRDIPLALAIAGAICMTSGSSLHTFKTLAAPRRARTTSDRTCVSDGVHAGAKAWQSAVQHSCVPASKCCARRLAKQAAPKHAARQSAPAHGSTADRWSDFPSTDKFNSRSGN